MAGKKINDLTALGRNLASTDLLELSLAGGTGSRKITGQEIINAIPSGITIGTTAITSGTVGRVLFQGSGNVVQQSTNLFWDATNNRLGIGTSSPLSTFEVVAGSDANGIKLRGRSADNISNFFFASNDGVSQYGYFQHRSTVMRLVNNVGDLEFWNGASIGSTLQRITLFGATGNLGIATTTDAGFKLDVNGTARVSGNFNIATGFELNFNNQNVGLYRSANNLRLGGFGGIEFLSSATTIASQTIRMTLFSTGNFAIGTTTDAGFKLDVNGTARVQSTLTAAAGFKILGAAGAGHRFMRTNDNGDIFPINAWNYGNATGNTWINGADVASSIFTLNTTTQGFLPPRMTTTQRNAIASPATGLIVYDTTLNLPHFYNGTIWVSL